MRKVLWRDGDLIGATHLICLEDWIEDLCAWRWRMTGHAGLIRPPKNSTLNLDPLIKDGGGTKGGKLLVKVSPLAAVTPEGRIVDFRDEVSADIPVPGMSDWVSVFVVPVNENQDVSTSLESQVKRARTVEEIEIGTPEFYLPHIVLKLSQHFLTEGVEIARIRFVGQLEIDRDFIPPCITMDSHDRLRSFGESLLGTLDRLAESSRAFRTEMVRQSETGARVSIVSQEVAREIENRWLMTSINVADLRVSPARFFTAILAFLKFVALAASELTKVPVGDLPKRLEDIRVNVNAGGPLFETVAKTESALRELLTHLEPLLRVSLSSSREIKTNAVGCRLLQRVGEWEYAISLERMLADELDHLGASKLTVSLELKEPAIASVRVYANKTVLEIPEDRTLEMTLRGKMYEFTFEPDLTERKQKTITFYTRSEPADQRNLKIMLKGA